MKVLELSLKEQHKFNDFVKKHPLGSIHQTAAWGIFQSKSAMRDKFWMLVVEDEQGQIESSALLIRQRLSLGKSWLYCPRGPVADYDNPKQLELLFQKIAQIAKKEKAIFLRFDPPLLDSFQTNIFLNAKSAHAHYQPENTLILDLQLSEEEILKNMKPKGRYNIKIAQKHEVKIRLSNNNPQDIESFHALLKLTTSRDNFSGHPLKYYRDMLDTLDSQAKLYLAEYQEKVIAGVIVTYFKDTAIYYFGASSNENRQTMAPYLLQWQAIKEAKHHGLKFYDFLGIAPENVVNHPWAGVTDFKLKFGGQRLNYLSAQEIIYQPLWYFGMLMAKKLRRIF